MDLSHVSYHCRVLVYLKSKGFRAFPINGAPVTIAPAAEQSFLQKPNAKAFDQDFLGSGNCDSYHLLARE